MTPTVDSVTIRDIEERDLDALHEMMRELADHEGEAQHLVVSTKQLKETGFCREPLWHGYIAECAGVAVAFTTYTSDFHIWSGAARIRLDDLYVRETNRGSGIGRDLMEAVFEKARKNKNVVSWQVQPTNKRAIAFYESLGAQYVNTGKCSWRPE